MARQEVYQGRKIRVARDIITTAEGREVVRDVVLHPGAVVILPLVSSDQVCLIQNYRFVVNQTLWELPAGTLEPGEPPEVTARRELEEETGYRAGSLRKLAAFFASPGVMDEVMHLFVAEQLEPGPARPEPGEDLKVHLVSWEQAVDWVINGTIQDAKTMTGILFWDRLRRS